MIASRPTQWLLASAFLLIIACEGVIQATSELRQGNAVQLLDLFRNTPTQQHLRKFESELEDRAWPAVMSRPAMQFVRHSLYNDLGEKAVVGRHGWLFYRPDVDFLIEPWPLEHDVAPLADDPLPAIVAFRDALAERGIDLLLVPTPGKPSIHPNRLSHRHVEFVGVSHHDELFDRLDRAGISYVDLFSAYENGLAEDYTAKFYLLQDTHWSSDGLKLAAKTVAKRLLAEGWVTSGNVDYKTEYVRFSRVGDVLRMVKAESVINRFTPEPIECEQILDPTGKPYADDPASPVLVLGDSFLRIFQRDEPGAAGFIAHLAHELNQPVASIVSDGGASTLVRQELQRNPDLLRNKKVVIWEFVERDLRFGMEGWKVVSL